MNDLIARLRQLLDEPANENRTINITRSDAHLIAAALSPQGREPAGVGEPVAKIRKAGANYDVHVLDREVFADGLPHSVYATPAPAQQAVTDGEALSAIMNAQPFVSNNDGTRVWQLFKDHVHVGDAIKAILAAAALNTTAQGASDARPG